MKNFILGFGKIIINIGIIVQLFATTIISIIVGCAVSSMNYNNEGLGILAGIGTFIALLIIVIMSNFIIYLIIDIHDSFLSISESLEFISENIHTKNYTDTIEDDD